MADLYCPKCRKTMSDKNFYLLKSKEHSDMCKTCETLHIDNYDPETFMWLCEKYDIPYIESEWNILRDRAYQKDPYKMNGMSVFGRYLSKMKLKQFMHLTFADTERLRLEAEENAKLYGTPEEQMQEKIEKMKELYEAGEISEAQYLTYIEINKPKMGITTQKLAELAAAGVKVPEGNPEYIMMPTQQPPAGYQPVGYQQFMDAQAQLQTQASPQTQQFYPENPNPFVQVDLPDVAADLTEEDKIYLATKWGRLYSPAEWVWLENKYNDFMNSFDIQGAARVDTLIFICKTSLKMNDALDSGDVDSYQKLSKAYDAQMKAAKFTEAQRKEEKDKDFDSVGQIVYFAELEGGAIPRLSTEVNRDIVDEAISNLKRYTRELIMNDASLAQQIENYIRKREAMEQQKADLREAQANGEDTVTLTDKDMMEFKEMIEKEQQEGEED